MALGISPTEIVAKSEYQLLTKADHWVRVPLGVIASVQNGYAFKSEYFDRNIGVPLIRIRDVASIQTEHRYNGPYDDEYLVNSNDILIGMDGDFLAARWRGDIGLLNQRVCRLSLKSDLFDEKFFFLSLQPFLNAINAETSSITVKHLSSKSVEAIPLPLPPLNEQSRIVAKIEELFSELDKGVESLTAARKQLKVYRQAVLQQAFEGKLTRQWREKNGSTLERADELIVRLRNEGCSQLTRIRGGELPDLPGGWAWVPYGQLCSSIRNGIAQKPDGRSGTKIFRISAVRPMQFDLDDVRYIDNADGRYDDYYLRSGDIVFTRYNGSRAYVGVAAEYRSDGTHLYPDKLIRTRLETPSLLPGFIEKAVNCGASRAFIESRIRTTAGQSGISGSDIKAMPVPICSPDEQAVINDHLNARFVEVDRALTEVEANLNRTDVLRQSILKKAFSGQLVPHDTNDEPASVLLQRMMSENAGSVAAKRGGRKARAAPREGVPA
jgi:type I restriction enzyme, S subunit